MQFDVKIRKVIENGKPLKALASVTVDGSFTIHNGLYATMYRRQAQYYL